MRREVILRPAGTISVDGSNQIQPGTSPYPQNNVPSLVLHEAWADEVNTSFYYPFDGQIGIVSFEAPPTLVNFLKLTLSVWWDYSCGGPNEWWFPPDNSFGPEIRLLLIGRNGSTQIPGSWLEAESAGWIAAGGGFVNTNTQGLNYFDLAEQTWEMTSHPEGGPFTFDDMLNLKAGIECSMSDGPNGKPYSDAARFPKLRMPKLRATLEVESLGAAVTSIRHSSSMSLRYFRRARNGIGPVTRIDKAVGTLGERIYFSHPRGPSVGGLGWGQRPLERRAGILLRRRYMPEQLKVADEVLDLRSYSCLFWAEYRIAGAWSPELQGVALLDKGGGFTHTRAQDGWSVREGDGRLMRVLEDYPNVSSEGLACQGGGDSSICLRNYDLTQSGWSATGDEAGEFTISQDSSIYMVEELGYQTSAELVFGSGGGTGGRYRSLGTLPYADGDFVHLDMIVRNTSVPTPSTQFLEWRLLRSGGGLPSTEYWDESNRTWTTSETNNPFPSDEPFGRVRADAVPLDAAGASSDPTYQIHIGRFSSSIASATFHAALVDVQHTDDQVAGARTPQVVLDSPIVRVADVHSLANSASAELWDYERGVVVVEAAPGWDGEAVPSGAIKPLAHCQHDTATYDALQLVAGASGAASIRFERAVSGEATFQLDVDIPNTGAGWNLLRGHVLRAWARWLGADGWRDFAPYSVEVGFVVLDSDGAVVEQGGDEATGSAVGLLSYTGSISARDALYVGNDPTPRYFDGAVRLIEVRRNPIDRLEALWRI